MFEATELNRKNQKIEGLIRILFLLMTALLILPVVLILGLLVIRGGGVISWEFLFTDPRDGMTAGGIFPALVGTIWLVSIALLASVPIGVAAALYLSEYAPDNWLTRLINLAIINLAGRYSHALDLGDTEAWQEIFTDDGVMDMVAQGYEIAGDRLRSLPAGRDPDGPGSRHIPSTFVIDGSGDEASMRSYVIVVNTTDPARIVFHGRYEDRLRRVGGDWRRRQAR